jgi:hypothetical protein
LIAPPNNRRSAPVYRLNDDSLLNIFYHYQHLFLQSYEDVLTFPDWDNARWWYKPAQVCQQWRHLILASPLRLGLNLICTYGTPVADMLAHSPSLPLIINYLNDFYKVSAEDEEGILLALQHRDRVRRIGLRMPAANLPKYIKAMDGEFPILERLFIWPPDQEDISWVLSKTLQAPHLGQLSLYHAALPAGSLLLTTIVGLTSLEPRHIPLSGYFPPSYLIARLSSMPHLECLSIGFNSPIPTRNVERQPLHPLSGTHVTLPNLCTLFFVGVSAYLERVLAQISAPLLDTLQIWLFSQLSFTVPSLFRFIKTDDFSFRFPQLIFHAEHVELTAEPWEGDRDRVTPLNVVISCRHIDWQVSAVAQIPTHSPVLSVVDGLALLYEEHIPSSEPHNEIDRTQWHNLLRPFSGIKALHVAGKLITNLAHSLQIGDGDSLPELFPELKELIYYKDGDPSDSFTSFIDARGAAGWPVNLIQVPPPHSLWQ